MESNFAANFAANPGAHSALVFGPWHAPQRAHGRGDGAPYRAMVVLAAWCGLRLGELLALTRRRVNLLHGTVEVVGSTYERADGTIVIGPPKTAAGRRVVSVTPHVLPELERDNSN